MQKYGRYADFHQLLRMEPQHERRHVLQTNSSHSDEGIHCIMVAAIDFGTTYSGYAFAFTSEPNNIRMNKNWACGQFNSYKTPTTILFGPNGFMHFGYEAIKVYSDCEEDEQKKLHLFKNFKMLLHNKTITKSLEIKATNGHQEKAVKVFAESLRFLKEHMLEAIGRTVVSDIDPDLIKWVITLPAIWSDEAKQFMREAALMAGCINSRNSNQLVLALEPEAASIFCRDVQVDPMAAMLKATASKAKFNEGTKYLIIDAGGGTVDITAHEVCRGGNIREILQPTGGPWGGTEVDKGFEELMVEMITPDVVDGLKKCCSQQWFTLMLGFENGKKRVQTDKPDTNIKLELNYDLCTAFEDLTRKNIRKGLSTDKAEPVFFSNGKLVISHDKCLKLFEKPISSIAEHVRKLLCQPELVDISFVLLVGGFGECEILQKRVEAILPRDIKLIVPGEAQLAIIKGAVRYGLRQNIVQSRVARKTYGIDIEPRFNEKFHDRSKRVVKKGIAYCNDVFLKFIDKGTTVNFNEVSSKPIFARTDDQQSMSFDIFCTDETDLNMIEYTSDPKFQRVGGLTVFMPDTRGGRSRMVEVQFKFGGTEIKVSAEDKTSGEMATTEVDMLLP